VRDRVAAEMPAELPDPGAAPVGDPALRRRIGQALERLPAAQRESFLLVHLEGFTASEAAAITGRATGTIKSHLHRALQALRAELGDLAPDLEAAAS
jgi:RNA polymerase sigma-70 factor (ECF subfamily)